MPDEVDKPIEERIDALFDDIKELFKKNGISTMSMVMELPGIDSPIIFFINPNNNHQYDAVALMASAIREMKRKMISELDC